MRGFILFFAALAGSVAGAKTAGTLLASRGHRLDLHPPAPQPTPSSRIRASDPLLCPIFSPSPHTALAKDLNEKRGNVLYKATYLNTPGSRTRMVFTGDFNTYQGSTVSTSTYRVYPGSHLARSRDSTYTA